MSRKREDVQGKLEVVVVSGRRVQEGHTDLLVGIEKGGDGSPDSGDERSSGSDGHRVGLLRFRRYRWGDDGAGRTDGVADEEMAG